MPKLDSPLQLSPTFKVKVWGRLCLDPLYPDSWTTRRGDKVSIRHPARQGLEQERIGEVWLTGDDAVFTNGPVAGLKLAEACEHYGPEICGAGTAPGRFPILSKFIFTNDWLSVQVHPDDVYARQHEPGSIGKCEMWYMIDAGPTSEFLLGFKPGLSKETFGSASSGRQWIDFLQRFRPKQGEAIFVPPGAVHALGPGLILFEAEENSDVTYRLDDFGRPGLDGKLRPLHLEKGLEVARPELPASRDLPVLEVTEPYGHRRLVLACRFFAVELLRLQKIASFTGSGDRVETLAVISGEGRVETSAGWYAYRPGDVWVIPPATPAYRLAPEAESSLLKYYVPNIDEDFQRPLASAGTSPEEAQSIIFPEV
jgi:mannose-6-phosphate isomerase